MLRLEQSLRGTRGSDTRELPSGKWERQLGSSWGHYERRRMERRGRAVGKTDGEARWTLRHGPNLATETELYSRVGCEVLEPRRQPGASRRYRLITVVRWLRQRLAEVLAAQTRRSIDQNYPSTPAGGRGGCCHACRPGAHNYDVRHPEDAHLGPPPAGFRPAPAPHWWG